MDVALGELLPLKGELPLGELLVGVDVAVEELLEELLALGAGVALGELLALGAGVALGELLALGVGVALGELLALGAGVALGERLLVGGAVRLGERFGLGGWLGAPGCCGRVDDPPVGAGEVCCSGTIC